MISFSQFGQRGRFGNQLFQYAYLRFTARRLGVKFYCPEWIGDRLFDLSDQQERASSPHGITHTYFAPISDVGFVQSARDIPDGTDVCGYFQSEKYFDDDEEVRRWYRFGNEITKVKDRFSHIDFDDSVSLSLRLGDYENYRDLFPLPSINYYKESLRLIGDRKHLLVFSDQPDEARLYFDQLDRSGMIFLEGNSDLEDFYLISQCRDNIITNSSFAWWGAWLNEHPEKTVILPTPWFRPGYGKRITGIQGDGWKAIRATTPILDHHVMWNLQRHIGWKWNRVRRLFDLTTVRN